MKMFMFANCQIGNFAASKASGHHPVPAALFMVDHKNPFNHPTPIIIIIIIKIKIIITEQRRATLYVCDSQDKTAPET